MRAFEPEEPDDQVDGDPAQDGDGRPGRPAARRDERSASHARLHLVKLAVGAPDLATMAAWVAGRAEAARRGGPPVRHRTRMRPKRVEELLVGGSLYWVIGGAIRARQALRDLRDVADDDGRAATDIILGETLTPTAVWPRRPFQGWRYLKPEDAPPDLDDDSSGADRAWDALDADAPPPALLRAIAEVGVR